MEKKYLEIKRNGITLGAFEDVTKFEETENGFKIESADGNFEFVKSEDGLYLDKIKKFPMVFDSYKMCGRRSFRRHTNNENKGYHVTIVGREDE